MRKGLILIWLILVVIGSSFVLAHSYTPVFYARLQGDYETMFVDELGVSQIINGTQAGSFPNFAPNADMVTGNTGAGQTNRGASAGYFQGVLPSGLVEGGDLTLDFWYASNDPTPTGADTSQPFAFGDSYIGATQINMIDLIIGSSGDQPILRWYSDGVNICSHTASDDYAVSNTRPMHYVMTLDDTANEIRYYINGTKIKTCSAITATIYANFTTLFIGHGKWYQTACPSCTYANWGNFSNFAIFTDAYSDADALWSYNSYAGTIFAGAPVTTGILNVTLDAPHTGVTNTSLSQNFSYQVVSEIADLSDCNLWTNSTSNGWTLNTTDGSPVNNSINKFSNILFQENEQSGTDIKWNVNCTDASGNVNASLTDWVIHLEEHLNISEVILTSPTPDQTLWVGDVGNTTDTTPTFNQTTNKQATCYIGTDNASWTICSTTDATRSTCTIGSELDYIQQSIYFTCNSTLTNIDYSERLVNIYGYPTITTPLPTNNSIITGIGDIEFNATIVDYMNTTLSCNFSNSTGVQATNTSVGNNTMVRFYQTLDNQNDYSWNITCSNGWYEGTSEYMNLSVNINYTPQTWLCPYIQRVEFYPNISYYNWTTGQLTQYGVLAANTTRCGFTYNITAGMTGTLQGKLNITFNSTFVLRYNNVSMNNGWTTIASVSAGKYFFNATGDYVIATADSPTFTSEFRVI